MNVSDTAYKNFVKLLFQMREIRERRELPIVRVSGMVQCSVKACRKILPRGDMMLPEWRKAGSPLLCPECYDRIKSRTMRGKYDLRNR